MIGWHMFDHYDMDLVGRLRKVVVLDLNFMCLLTDTKMSSEIHLSYMLHS